MTAVVDTSFLVALSNTQDRNYARVLNVAKTVNEPLVLPVSVLPEACYMLASRSGHKVMRQFLNELIKSDTILESITLTDLQRVSEILDKYADNRLDFVDATIVAIAERKSITRIFTLDRRDFSVIRPKHCSYFEILP